jgi:hypothetical protein
MTLDQVRGIYTELRDKYEAKLSGFDVKYDSEIYLEDDGFDKVEALEESGFISLDINVFTEKIDKDNGLCFCSSVTVAKDRVDDDEILDDVKAFEESLEEFLAKLAAAESADEQGQIHINLDNKKICFSDSVFAESCAEMIQTYGGGSFKKGTYYSINGTKVDEGAYVFNFREAVEHNVKMGTRGIAAGASRQRSNSFSIADRNGTQDRVTPMPARGYGAARG